MDDRLLIDLAREYGTPLFAYDGELIRQKCKSFKDAFSDFPIRTKFCYAVKANSNLAILSLIRGEGFGADIVSVGELEAATRAGFSPENIIFNSSSKSAEDVKAAVDAKINMTVGNTQEIDLVAAAGGEKIAFRVNPNVDAKTHPKISTSLMGSKFGLHFEGGVAEDAVKKALDLGLNVSGIQCHIGSNVKEMSGFTQAAEKMFEFAQKLKDTHSIELDFIDLGGGLGVRYKGESVVSVEDFAKAYLPIVTGGVKGLGYKPLFCFEPGRYIVAESGVMDARVNSVKKTPTKNFINVDAGFNNLIRPAMYDAYHGIRVLGKTGDDILYDVAGNLCESGDFLGKDRLLPETENGDYIGVENAGAYGFSMSSNYNSQPFASEVLIRGKRTDLIRSRQRIEDLFERQTVPDDLA